MSELYLLRDTAHSRPYTGLAHLCRHHHTSIRAAANCRDAKRAAAQLANPDTARVMKRIYTHANGPRWEEVPRDAVRRALRQRMK